jgi:hypothetical protein
VIGWTLLRDNDGYWYWEHDDGRESPSFCVKQLALQWKANYVEVTDK